MRLQLALLVLTFAGSVAFGQSTYTVLYNFGAYPGDGTGPSGGLMTDAAGNFYGVTIGGGAFCQAIGGCGTIYELSSAGGGAWTDAILYSFCSSGNPDTCPDGSNPIAGLVTDKAGNLYGTTSGGGASGQGDVFRLSPPQQPGGAWTETVLWSFGSGKNNGTVPGFGKLNIDGAGNIYGTTSGGGNKDIGTVFELSPAGNGTYTFSILHSFSGPDGANPQYGVAIDSSGNLYGTTKVGGPSNPACTGGTGCGLVYELSRVNGKWKETVLYNFKGGSMGSIPVSPIYFDQVGDLYGTFLNGGQLGNCTLAYCGGVFKLVPPAGTGKAYIFTFNGQDGGSPQGGVLPVSDSLLFGTSSSNIFQIQGKTETVLYTFCSLPHCADGQMPGYGTLIRRSKTLYGVTLKGGLNNNSGVLYSVGQ